MCHRMTDALTLARAAVAAANTDAIPVILGGLPDRDALVDLLYALAESVQDSVTAVIPGARPTIDVAALAGLSNRLASLDIAPQQAAFHHEQSLRFCEGEEGVMDRTVFAAAVTRILITEHALKTLAQQ